MAVNPYKPTGEEVVAMRSVCRDGHEHIFIVILAQRLTISRLEQVDPNTLNNVREANIQRLNMQFAQKGICIRIVWDSVIYYEKLELKK